MWSDDFTRQFNSPYDKRNNYYICLEAMGKFVFAGDSIVANKLQNIMVVSSAEGYGAEYLAQFAKHVTGVSADKKMVDKAIKNAQTRNISNVKYHYTSIDNEEIDWPKETFDAITCFDSPAKVVSPAKTLKDLFNLLKPGGYFYLSVPDQQYEPMYADGRPATKGHIHTFTAAKIKRLVKDAGFEILNRYGQPYTNIFLNEEYFIINRHKLSERFVKSLYSYEKERILYFARLYSYPILKFCENSYSIFLFCRKPS